MSDRVRPRTRLILGAFVTLVLLCAKYLYVNHLLLDVGTDRVQYSNKSRFISTTWESKITAIIQNGVHFAQASTQQGLNENPVRTTSTTTLEMTSTTVRTTTPSSSTTTRTPHDIQFTLHNPRLCTYRSINWIMYVYSSTVNMEQRMLLRSTWANVSFSEQFELVFLLGVTLDKRVQQSIEMEHREYGDIVQGDFLDTYKNLTMKGIMGLKWVLTYCPNAPIVIKVDDDVFVNTIALLEEIQKKYVGKKSLIACRVTDHGPILRERSKWKVDSDVLPGRHEYPRYCQGQIYIMTRDLAVSIYRATHWTSYFWIEDIYFTGLILEKIRNVTYEDLSPHTSILQGTLQYAALHPFKFIYLSYARADFVKLWKYFASKPTNATQWNKTDIE